MTSLLGFEPLVDQTINHFCSRLEQEFVDGPHAGEAFDMKNWITYCKLPKMATSFANSTERDILVAWDTMSQITFSHTLGFLDKGGDVHDLIHGSNKFTDYVTVVRSLVLRSIWSHGHLHFHQSRLVKCPAWTNTSTEIHATASATAFLLLFWSTSVYKQ